MPGLLTTASVLMCPHGGTVTISSSNSKATAGGSPLVVANDTFTIAGCPFPPSGPPHPCASVKWVSPATGSTVGGAATLTRTEASLLAAVLPNPVSFDVTRPSAYVRGSQAWIYNQSEHLDAGRLSGFR